MNTVYASKYSSSDKLEAALADLLAPAVQTVPIFWIEEGSIRAQESLPVDIKDFSIGSQVLPEFDLGME